MGRPPITEEELVQISVRLPKQDLKVLERIGKGMKPVPAGKNALIRAAVKDFIQQQAPEQK